MKILIVEDDFVSRRLLKEILSRYGDCDIVIDGNEAVDSFIMGHQEKMPYDLICMDIMMPNMNGIEALKMIRDIERIKGISGAQEVKVIMITALGDPKTVVESYYHGGATSYIVKPIDRRQLIAEMRNIGLKIN